MTNIHPIKFRAVIDGEKYYFTLQEAANLFALTFAHNITTKEEKRLLAIYNWLQAGNQPDRFIGLQSRKVDAYENDAVRHDGGNLGCIFYCNRSAKFKIKWDDDKTSSFIEDYDYEDYTIVSTTHDPKYKHLRGE